MAPCAYLVAGVEVIEHMVQVLVEEEPRQRCGMVRGADSRDCKPACPARLQATALPIARLSGAH